MSDNGRMAGLTVVTLVAIAGLVGGWEWALVFGFVLLVTHRIRPYTTALLGAAAPGLFWVVMFYWSGDRRLFFPCTMQYAVQLTCLLRERGVSRAVAAAGSVLTLFVGIRLTQMVTRPVLAVELVVATVVLVIVLGVSETGPIRISRRMLMGAIGSVLAFLGLFV